MGVGVGLGGWVGGVWLVRWSVFPDFIIYQKKDAESYSGIIYDSFSYVSYCSSRRADGQKNFYFENVHADFDSLVVTPPLQEPSL